MANSDTPKIPQDQLAEFINLYQFMATAREIDLLEEQYVARGEAFFHVSGAGHEAVATLNPHLIPEDYLHCHYRDKALMLARGISSEMFFYSFFCKDASHSRGRQMSAHMSDRRTNILSLVGPVGNNALQAVGIAAEIKNQPQSPIVYCGLGDGTTQQGEVLEAIAESVRWKLPVLFLVQDNKYAISTITHKKTFYNLPDKNAQSFYGLPLLYLEGKDPVSCYRSLKGIVTNIRTSRTPALVIMSMERLANHTNADDQSVYRDSNEIHTAIKEYDPIVNLKRDLELSGIKSIDIDCIHQSIRESLVEVAKQVQLSKDPLPCLNSKKNLLDHLLVTALNEYRGGSSSNSLTMLEAMRKVLYERMVKDTRITLYGEDIEDPKGDVFGLTLGLSTAFPERVFNSPLSESTIVGTSIGRALAGGRPVGFLQFADFIPLAFNQIASEMGTMFWRTDGAWQCPVILMITCGGYRPGLGPFHAQSMESLAVHTPGIDVAMPSTAGDAAGILNSAFDSGRPTLIFYPKSCLNLVDAESTTSPDTEKQFVPIGKARVVRAGVDITFVTYGNATQLCLKVATSLEAIGVESEVIDLRWLSPWDEEAVLKSALKTAKVLVVHEDNYTCGMGSEVLATIAEKSPISIQLRRVARPDTHIPCNFANQLEILPSFKRILEAAADLLDLEVEWAIPTQSNQGNSTVIEAVGLAPSDQVLTILELCIKPGDQVSEGQTVAVLETSKAILDFECPVQGIVEEVFVAENQEVLIGAPLFRVTLSADSRLAPKPVTREEIGQPIFKPKKQKQSRLENHEIKNEIAAKEFSSKIIESCSLPSLITTQSSTSHSQGKSNPDLRIIVPVKPDGDKRPFFYVHGLGGYHPTVNSALAKYFDQARPLFGIQALGLDGKNLPHTSIEEMARFYISEIKKIESKGPYLIGGVCLGGSIAFEIAQQLKQQGDQVLSLVMVDSPRPFLNEKEVGFLADIITQQSQVLIGQSAHPWSYDSTEENIPPSILSFFRVWKANIQALGSYRPKQYSDSVTYISSVDKIVNSSYFDPSYPNSWYDLVTSKLEIQLVPGNHLTMLFDPNVKYLSEKINICLDFVDSI